MDLELSGKRALITGSSKGIGTEIAKVLALEGVRVVIHGRNEEAARSVAEQIGGGDRVAVVIGELSDPDGVTRVANEALEAFGGIDVLVNNAGVVLPSNWDKTQPRDWARLYNTNVVPAVSLCARFAPLMKERGWGRLIHIGSSSAAIGLPKSPEYAATKAALAAMSSSLAKHYGEFGVTSNILGVGTINNLGLLKGKDADQSGAAIYGMVTGGTGGHYNINPLKRMGTCAEVAYIVAILASPRSSFVNGALIRVDGGKVPTIGL
jgi:NAD(P)-dependent dehydrogenase (short-subunit alcohol dehydrogenase family)